MMHCLPKTKISHSKNTHLFVSWSRPHFMWKLIRSQKREGPEEAKLTKSVCDLGMM